MAKDKKTDTLNTAAELPEVNKGGGADLLVG